MKLNALQLIWSAGPVVKFVLVLLIVTSIVSWAIIFLKFRVLRKSRRNSEKFLDLFWSQKNMETAYRKAENMAYCPVASVFRAAYSELAHSRDAKQEDDVDSTVASVERAIRRSISSQQTLLERRVVFLATTGSSAPFIGLFGTVWGIMNAFISIGAKGASNLAVVAPGIAEALIATAVGLVAAIPAVIGYNYCASQIRLLTREMENFSNDFVNVIKRQIGAS